MSSADLPFAKGRFPPENCLAVALFWKWNEYAVLAFSYCEGSLWPRANEAPGEILAEPGAFPRFKAWNCRLFCKEESAQATAARTFLSERENSLTSSSPLSKAGRGRETFFPSSFLQRIPHLLLQTQGFF